uniref:Aminopeptidase n=1 Tax=Syphacia muris TaxID=451379 RepID=A0A0N5AFC4_9BILA
MILTKSPYYCVVLFSILNIIHYCNAQIYLQNPTKISIITPIKYDITIQVPIASDGSLQEPGFVGSLMFEFQLNHLAEESRYAFIDSIRSQPEEIRPSFPVYDEFTDEDQKANALDMGTLGNRIKRRNITFDSLITETRLGALGMGNAELDEKSNSVTRSAILEPTSMAGSIKLNARNLTNFENITLTINGETITVTGIQQTNDEIEFFTEKELQSGRYVLYIEQYSGIFSNNSGAYFRNVGNLNTIISVDLFPNLAATVFPCIDSFSTRAHFQLTLLHPFNTTVISNTPIIEGPDPVGDLWMRTKFYDTPQLPTYLFGFTILPAEYKGTLSRSSPIPLTVYANTLTVLDEFVQCLIDVSTTTITLLKDILIEDLELPKIDIVLIPDFDEVVQSYGMISFGENVLLNTDEANMIFNIVQQIAHLWIGGLTNIAATREYCFMKDLTGYVAMKAMKIMTNNDNRYTTFRLAHQMKIQIAENFMFTSESLTLPSQLDRKTLLWRCNLKGILMLESIESVIGEEQLLNHIRTVLRSQRFSTFSLDDFLSLLRGYIVDGGINLAQTYDFWQKNGGFPAVSAVLHNDTMRLIQLNYGRLAKMGSFTWVQMPVWPLRLTLSSAPSPLYFMTTEGLDLAPMPNYTVSMVNLGFDHFYRVNYDITVWKQIQSIMRNNPEQFTKQARAQLINDFCYFSSQGMHEESNATEEVRRGWVKLIRDQPSKFDLCEWYIYGCEAGTRPTITAMKDAKETLWEMEAEIREAFEDSERFGCGIGSSGSVANRICNIIYGIDCL